MASWIKSRAHARKTSWTFLWLPECLLQYDDWVKRSHQGQAGLLELSHRLDYRQACAAGIEVLAVSLYVRTGRRVLQRKSSPGVGELPASETCPNLPCHRSDRLCVCVCACMHVCVYIYIHISISIYIYMHAHPPEDLCPYMYVCMYVCMHVCMLVCLYIRIEQPIPTCSAHWPVFIKNTYQWIPVCW